MELSAGKYMLADNGENVDAIAAAKMIKRFWDFVKMEYGFWKTGRGSNGVVSVRSLLSPASVSCLAELLISDSRTALRSSENSGSFD